MQSYSEILDFYKRSLKVNSITLKEIPDEYKTVGICLLSIQSNGNNIKYIPLNIFNNYQQQFISDAIDSNILSIFLIPKNYIDYDLCYKILNHRNIFYLLEKIKQNKLKYESIYQILFSNIDLVLDAIRNRSVEIMRYCPKNMFTSEFIIQAIKSNKNAIRYIPKKLKSYELYEKIIDSNPSLLNMIPKKFKTKELCVKVYNIYKIYWVATNSTKLDIS